jgi:hypothetical protein
MRQKRIEGSNPSDSASEPFLTVRSRPKKPRRSLNLGAFFVQGRAHLFASIRACRGSAWGSRKLSGGTIPARGVRKMARELLSARGLESAIKAARAQAEAKNTRVKVRDGDNLMLIVRPGGGASWVLQYRLAGQRRPLRVHLRHGDQAAAGLFGAGLGGCRNPGLTAQLHTASALQVVAKKKPRRVRPRLWSRSELSRTVSTARGATGSARTHSQACRSGT